MEYEERQDSYGDDSSDNSDEVGYCEECKWLMDAVRDYEQQCREAENQRANDTNLFDQVVTERIVGNETLFLAKIRRLERRRDAALDVLAKHQQLEHQ